MRAPLDPHRRFLDRLRKGRVGMAGARQIFRGAAELHQHRAFMDELAGHRTEDVHAEHPVGLRIRQHLDEAVGRLIGFGPTVGEKRELADLVGAPCPPSAPPRSCPTARHFGIGVDDRRDHAVVHMSRLARQALGECHAFVFCLVREHRAADDIADGVDSGEASSRSRSSTTTRPLSSTLDAGLIQSEALRVGNAPDGDQDGIGLEAFFRAALRRSRSPPHALGRSFDADDLGRKA